MTEQTPVYQPVVIVPQARIHKTVLFLLAGVVVFAGLFLYLIMKNNAAPVVETEKTSALQVVDDTRDTAGEVTNLKVALRQYVPIMFDTATVTYDYKEDKLAVSYCGDYQKVLSDLQDHLKSLKLDNRRFDEKEILFTTTGECAKATAK